MNDSVYRFFKVPVPSKGDPNEKKIEFEMNENLATILKSLSVLHDIIPAGQAVEVKFIHGKIVLASASPNDPRRVTQLIVSKPLGVLELSANTGGAQDASESEDKA